MSDTPFIKGACQHCAGHLEFPADAVGTTVPCPHCHQPTELRPLPAVAGAEDPGKAGSLGRLLFFGIFLVAAGAAAAFLHFKHPVSSPPMQTPAPLPTNPPTTATAPAPPLPPAPLPEIVTNDFAIYPFKLEKTPGSSLVYVVGRLKNLKDSQRFGVKIEFVLSDTNDLAAGTATDYQSVIDPNGEWHFKALVMSSKAVSVQFGSIQEEK